MELERVSRISVGGLGLEICWHVNDINGVKWTFFHTNTTTNTQSLGNKCDFRSRSDLNTKFTGLDHRTGLSAFLLTLFGLASVRRDNGDSRVLVTHTEEAVRQAQIFHNISDADYAPYASRGVNLSSLLTDAL